MPDSPRHRELYDLLAIAAEGELSPDQLARLEALTANDADARRIYRQSMYTLAYLEHFGARVDEEVSAVGRASRDKQPQVDPSDPGRGASPTSRKSLLNWASRHPKGPAIAIAVAVMVMIVGAMAITPVSKWIAERGKEDRQPEVAEKSEFVAILNSAHNATWVGDTQPRLKDPRLRIGRRLAISSGLVEIKYYTGASVVIEGPAEFYVGRMKDEGGRLKKEEIPRISTSHPSSFIPHPSNAGFLRLGKLVARVEGEEAKGFTIETPSARVEDLGTEFGVEVGDDGESEVVVLAGEVDVVSDRGDGPEQRVRLVKDEGAFVAASGGVILRRDSIDANLAASMRHRLTLIRQLAAANNPREPGQVVLTPRHIASGYLKGTLVALQSPKIGALRDGSAGSIGGWEQLSGVGNDHLGRAAIGRNAWEPDGTSFDDTNIRFTGGVVAYTFELPSNDVTIHAVYANWAGQGNAGAANRYSHNEGEGDSTERAHTSVSKDDLVLLWKGFDAQRRPKTYQTKFERLFTDIHVTDGSFTLTFTAEPGKAPWTDAVVLDYTDNTASGSEKISIGAQSELSD